MGYKLESAIFVTHNIKLVHNLLSGLMRQPMV